MIQNEVFLDNIPHIYKGVSDGRIYESVSRVLKMYEPFVDWDSIAGKVAGKGKFKDYPTKEAVLKLWKDNAKEAMDYGTAWHNSIERYQKMFTILPEDKDKEPVIKEIASHYKDYYRIESEATLYHPEYGLAGTSDKIIVTKKGGEIFLVADYKTALKTGGIDYFNKDGLYMLGPVSHLQSCKFVKYNLQLSIYAFMMERLTGMKCGGMWVTFIKEGSPLQRIYMNYLKNEAEAILKDYHLKHSIHQAVVIDSTEAPLFITE